MRVAPRPHADRPAVRLVLAGEGGYGLVMVAMLLFAFFGLAGLVVDLGLARLTQSIMQTAADTAALEGLRFRDELPPDVAGDGCADGATPEGRDCRRRTHVRAWVSRLFDADPAVTGAPTLGNVGAGPVIDLVGGSGDGAGVHQTIALSGSPAYTPLMQLNLAQQPWGDMVAGTHVPGAPPGETSLYGREDFAPAPPGSTSATASSFLARLRRTPDRQGVDDVAGVSSAGPPLPYLFGRGSTMAPQPGAAYDPRLHGLTVRGTAIAGVRPALAVGLSDPEAGVIGVTPFSIARERWTTGLAARLPDGTCPGPPCTIEIEVAAGGPIQSADGDVRAESGWYVGAPLASVIAPPGPIGPAPSGPHSHNAYLPVFDAGLGRIVGFAGVLVDGNVPAAGEPPGIIAITKLAGPGPEPGRVGANASAVIADLDAFQAVEGAHAAFVTPAARPSSQPLLAPILVR